MKGLFYATSLSIYSPFVKGTSEKLWFYIESFLRKLFCKPKDRVATEDQKTITFIKMAVATVKQSTLPNLNGP